MKMELVGYVAGLLVAVALAPQVAKTWKTKSASDISVAWITVLALGLLLWVVYAVANDIRPLILFGSIELLFALTILTLKLFYSRTDRFEP